MYLNIPTIISDIFHDFGNSWSKWAEPSVLSSLFCKGDRTYVNHGRHSRVKDRSKSVVSSFYPCLWTLQCWSITFIIHNSNLVKLSLYKDNCPSMDKWHISWHRRQDEQKLFIIDPASEANIANMGANSMMKQSLTSRQHCWPFPKSVSSSVGQSPRLTPPQTPLAKFVYVLSCLYLYLYLRICDFYWPKSQRMLQKCNSC